MVIVVPPDDPGDHGLSSGNTVTITGEVEVKNDVGNPLPVSGTVSVDNFPSVGSSVAVTNFPAVQPVSATSLPLPAGASTSSLQTTGNTSLSSIASNTTGLALDSTLTSGAQKSAIQGVAKGLTTALGATVSDIDADHSALDVNIIGGSLAGSVSVTNFPATQNVAITSSVEVEVKNDTGNPLPVSGTVNVSNFPATQPISATALPLPTGAATSALQGTGNTSLLSIDSKLGSLGQKAMSGSAPVVIASDQSAIPISGTVTVTDGSGPITIDGTVTANAGTGTFAVSAASLPLPAGAATSALQTTGNASLSSIVTNTTGLALDATLTGGTQKSILHGIAKGSTVVNDATVTPAGTDHNGLDVNIVGGSTAVTGTVAVSNFPATQNVAITSSVEVEVKNDTGNPIPVNGTVSVGNFPATQPVSAASLPLPAGASTSALQTTGNGSLSSIVTNTTGLALDTTLTGGNQQSKITDGSNVASVKAASTAAVATDKALVVAISPNNTLGVTVSNFPATQPISATALPLPTGAATSALQTTGNTSLGTIATNTTGLALDATLTNSTQKSQITDGTNVATVKAASTAAVAADKALVVSVSPNTPVAVTGTFFQATQPVSGSVSVSNFPATQPVSGTVTANIGTTNGLALDATLTGGTAKSRITDGTNTAAVKAASTASVATDPALVVAISPNNSVAVTGTFFQATQPVSAASLPLPAGAATSAAQTTMQASLSSIDGKLGTLGQKTMAGSAPVVIASDQSAIPITGSVTVSDGAGPLTVDGTVTANAGTGTFSTSEVPPASILNGHTTVATAGTRVALAASTAAKSVTIKGLLANTGIIYVGNSTVSSTNGLQLLAGDTVSIDIANLSTLNIDSSVSGEGVSYVGNV